MFSFDLVYQCVYRIVSLGVRSEICSNEVCGKFIITQTITIRIFVVIFWQWYFCTLDKGSLAFLGYKQPFASQPID